MNTGIIHFAQQTSNMLYNIGCREDGKKIDDAKDAFNNAIKALKELQWDSLCAIRGEKRYELIIHQRNVIKCYTKLKRSLLEVYRDIFLSIKDF